MSKYILAYDMLCFLSCTRYSLWVYQCSLVYRFMINLFSIYKKALLIPRSGLDELPDTTLFGLLIYWNDLQLSSHVFPEHNRNQPLMNEVSERQGQSCSFWDLGQGWSPSQQEMVSGEKLPLMGTAAVLGRANEKGQTVFVLPPKHGRTPCKAKLTQSLVALGYPRLQTASLVNMLDMYVSGVQSMETSAMFRDCFCSSAC